MDAAIIEKEALLLPESERALLADRLIESISHITSKVKSAWIQESDERMKAYRSGRIESVDGPQAIGKIRTRLGR